MESVYEKFSTNIIKNEYQNFQPISILNLNAINKKTTFKVDVGDNFVSPQFKYYISGKVVQHEDGKDFPTNSKIKLIDNFVPHLFTEIEVKKHNKLLDQIEYVGVASTIKGTVSYSLDGNGPTINSGFQSQFLGGGYFCTLGNLSNFGLGFFKDVKYPIYKGGFELTFTRNEDEYALHKEPDDPLGKIIIEEFLLRVPVITYDDITKVELINELKELSIKNHYTFNFRSWQTIQHKNLSGKTLNLDVTNIYRNIHNPLFGIVAFQTDKSPNPDQLKDNSGFNHCNIKNIWFEVNSKRYPEELLDLDWKNSKFAIAYDMLMDYKKVFVRTYQELPLIYVNPKQFKTARPFYVIDLTRQPQNTAEAKNNIILHVDFNENVPNNTICYVCMISNSEFIYDIVNNTIRENI